MRCLGATVNLFSVGNILNLICRQGEGWEDVDDEEEDIDVGSGSAFAPASDFVGEKQRK